MDSGFGKLWKKSGTKNHQPEADKAVIGILVFEVSTMMSKLVNLWVRLGDKKIDRLRKEVVDTPGVCKFVSNDVNYLINLILVEIMDDLGGVAESVARLGKRCVDPSYHHLEHVIEYFVEFDSDWCVWEYRYTKMERKVKKMVRFSAITAQLYQELEALAELDQSISRMRAGVGLSKVKLHDAREKIIRQRQEVKKLRGMSPWIRTYDYTVRLLLRSLLTILERVKQVFGIDQVQAYVKPQIYSNGSLVHSQSMYVLKQPFEYTHPTSDSRPLGISISNLGQNSVKEYPETYELNACNHSSILCGKPAQGNTRQLSNVGSFKGCSLSQSDYPAMLSCVSTNNFSLKSSAFQKDIDKINDTSTSNFSHENIYCSTISPFISTPKLLISAPQSTLGGAALAVHYANVILYIKKLASSPLISLDARDDLYDMLPATIRTSISAKLKLFTKTLASSIYDATLAAQWNFTMRRILQWLVPLANNMIKWRSERNFENQRIVCGTSVLLVQTLYFANQEKTEAAITELLMGLNYISRFGKEFCGKAVQQFSCILACDDYISIKDMSKPTTQKTSPTSLT